MDLLLHPLHLQPPLHQRHLTAEELLSCCCCCLRLLQRQGLLRLLCYWQQQAVLAVKMPPKQTAAVGEPASLDLLLMLLMLLRLGCWQAEPGLQAADCCRVLCCCWAHCLVLAHCLDRLPAGIQSAVSITATTTAVGISAGVTNGVINNHRSAGFSYFDTQQANSTWTDCAAAAVLDNSECRTASSWR